MSKRLPFLSEVAAIGNKATAYVCENFVCKMPTNDLDVFRKKLQ